MDRAIAFQQNVKKREQELRDENAYLRAEMQRNMQRLATQTDRINRFNDLFSRTLMDPDDDNPESADPSPGNDECDVSGQQRIRNEGTSALNPAPNRAEPPSSSSRGEPDTQPVPVEVLPSGGGADLGRPATEHVEPE